MHKKLTNEKDMLKEGLKKHDEVNLSSHYNGQQRIAKKFLVVPYQIPPTNVATYFPEANVLVPIDLFAKKSLTPASKRVTIKIKKA